MQKIRPLIRLLLLINCLFVAGTVFCAKPPLIIRDYTRVFIPCYNKNNELYIALRFYYVDAKQYFLVVNPNTLVTYTAPSASFSFRKNVNSRAENVAKGKSSSNFNVQYFRLQELQQTPYMRALAKYSAPPYVLQNYGLTAAEQNVDGMFLTIDLCPSSKPLEKHFFQTLVALAQTKHRPLPVALAVSGLWMLKHVDEMQWLINVAKARKLQITWVNHSYSHVYYPDVPLHENFLLSQRANFIHEILTTEKMLLEQGQTPSVFFRFPGLVADKNLILQLHEFGLIPLGSAAWLAKGEIPKNGSIILVHGNSNEPLGIKKLLLLVQQRSITWLPLTAQNLF